MVAWWDDMPWSARDEDRRFDGTAFYGSLAEGGTVAGGRTLRSAPPSANDAVAAAARELHEALAGLDLALDTASAYLLEAEPTLRAGDRQVGTDPAAFEEQAA